MPQNDEESNSNEVLANLLNTVDFPEVIKIVDKIKDGKYNILPYITKVQSGLMSISPFNLSRCCRVTTLILPKCTGITDNVIMLLPYLESLTIKSNCGLTPDVFRHLNYLTKLQILSHHENDPDTLITLQSLEHLSKLEMLHVRNPNLRDEFFFHLRNLKVLVLEGNTNVTPAILNYLPSIEICILNRKLYRFISSTLNNDIIKKIGKINRVKIYAIETD
jgi:hypothetical protein